MEHCGKPMPGNNSFTCILPAGHKEDKNFANFKGKHDFAYTGDGNQKLESNKNELRESIKEKTDKDLNGAKYFAN